MSTVDLIQTIDSLGDPKVAVIGDLILDHYVFGAVSRISPEAPIPVLHVRSEEDRLEGEPCTHVRRDPLAGCSALPAPE
jgi:bifunctional ADP-heptose synthase (sugar kinase/adenylyltransferase)